MSIKPNFQRSYNHGNPNADINDLLREDEEEDLKAIKNQTENNRNSETKPGRACPQCGTKLAIQLRIVADDG